MSRVRGIKHFSEYFKDVENEYVIIGGTAADVIMNDNELDFRATKDVDIVILTNTSVALNSKIKDYVTEGKYKNKERNSEKQYYRFSDPENSAFPHMLEIFARNEEELDLFSGQHIIPIENDAANKLSAILLDDEYFELIKNNCIKSSNGYSIISLHANICLKSRAYREMQDRKANGEAVDSDSIKKHRNDVVRLSQLLDGASVVDLGQQATDDLNKMISDIDLNLTDITVQQLLNSRTAKKSEIVSVLIKSYNFST